MIPKFVLEAMGMAKKVKKDEQLENQKMQQLWSEMQHSFAAKQSELAQQANTPPQLVTEQEAAQMLAQIYKQQQWSYNQKIADWLKPNPYKEQAMQPLWTEVQIASNTISSATFPVNVFTITTESEAETPPTEAFLTVTVDEAA